MSSYAEALLESLEPLQELLKYPVHRERARR
jgi:hypothetical protein